ncbi:glycosyltransferase family 4 protein [Candidatus Microgenomates bacterium]|nr:glycosyltransferase family 4 protein [Candidatus Microgenomates bacterium]
MRIVFIDKEDDFGIDGIIVYNKRLYQYLTSQKHKVFFLRFAKKKLKEKYIYQIPYYLAEKRSYIFLPSERTLNIIRSYLKKICPDIVYISAGNSIFDFFLPGLCHELGIPIIGVFHSDFNKQISSLQLVFKSLFLVYLPFCKQLDSVHVFSNKLKKFYIRRGINPEKIFVLPHGANTSLYQPGKSLYAQNLRIKTGILFLGRLTFQKNPELIIEAFLNLNPPPDTKLILVGTGELEEILRRHYKDPRVIFTGLVKNEKKKIDIIRACQIFVQPSRYEGMSLALLEAMSIGLAPVVSDAGTHSELVADAGILISESKLKQQLPLALQLLLQYPEFTKILGQKARNKVVRRYSQQIIFQQLAGKMQNVIDGYNNKSSLLPQENQFDITISKKIKQIWKKIKELGISI